MVLSKWKLPPSGGHMEKQDGIYLQNMTMKQVEERLKKNDLIIIPLGATENHGPHAPIGEDIYLVCRMAELVAQSHNLSGTDHIPIITWACRVRCWLMMMLSKLRFAVSWLGYGILVSVN